MFCSIKNRVFPLLTLLLTCIVIVACNMSNNGSKWSESQRQSLDSTLAKVDDQHDLTKILNHYVNTDDEVGQMLVYKRLGKFYRDKSKYEEAITAHDKGLEIATRLNDTVEMIRALNNLGTNYRRLSVMDEASSYHYQALALCEQMADQKGEAAVKNRVMSLNGIGNIYMTLDDRSNAERVLRMALQGESQLGSYLGQAINYANLGAIKESSNQIDSAWIYYRKSMEMNKKANSALGVALCYEHYGHLYEIEGKYAEAKKEYLQAYQLLEKQDDSWHWLEACASLAMVSILSNEVEDARRYIAAADSVSKSINSVEHQADVYRLKYELAKAQGDNAQALENYIKYQELSDSVTGLNKVNIVQNFRVKLEQDRRQSEVKLIDSRFKAEQRSKRLFIIVAILAIALGVMLTAFMWYRSTMREKNQALLRKIDDARASFFTNITHEFRTPLTLIMGLSRSIADNDHPEVEELHHKAAVIERQGNNLLQMINELLEISKMESEIGEAEWKHGNVIAFIRMIWEEFEELSLKKRVHMTFVAIDEKLDMDFVPKYMQRILSNLIANAIKFSKNNGEVKMTTWSESDFLKIKVYDNGNGIHPDDLPHLFEPFFQGSTSNEGNMGTGIGLSLVNKLVEALGGSITVDSELNKWTEFVVSLPIKNQGDVSLWTQAKEQLLNGDFQGQVTHTLGEETPMEDADGEGQNVTSIVIVEDHSDVSYYIGNELKGHGYNLYYAANGLEGIEKSKAVVPDLIITDLMMPTMDGYEFCRRIRNDEILSHVPIVVVSAKYTDDDKVRAIEAGADVFLVKPFSGKELNAVVSRQLKRSSELREKVGATLRENGDPSALLKEQDSQLLERLNSAIEQHMTDEWGVEELASYMCMSKSQLRRKILAITGMSTVSYVNKMRMDKAVKLMTENPLMPIGDVAEACGFYDISYFSRSFKQYFGVTPTQYRKNTSDETTENE